MSIKRRLDSGAWEVSIPRKGRTTLRKSSSAWSRADALAYEQKYQAVDHTLEDCLDKWLDEYVPFLRSPAQYRNKAEILRPFLKGQPIEAAADVAKNARKEWAALKPATINRRLTILRRICHLAFKKWDWIHQPIGSKISMLPERNERHLYLTRAEVERLRMNCTDPDAGNLIVFAAFTGLRWSEMFRATARDVVNGSLRLDARTKNGRPRAVPLHPRALHIANQLPLKITPALLVKQWAATRKASGLQHMHWHDLRHTFASWLVQKGTQIQVVQELMGHTNINQTMRYAHLTTDNLKSAIDNL